MSIPAEHLERLRGDEPEKPELVREPEKPAVDVASELAVLKQQNEDLVKRLESSELTSRKALEVAAKPSAAPAEPAKEPDWDNMSTKEIVQTVIEEVKRGNDELERKTAIALTQIRLEHAIEKSIEKHPDFMQYADEIVKLTVAKEGKISPEEAYRLVKAEQEEKAAVKKSEAAKPGASGVTPRSPASKTPPAPASSREAASQAFKAVFGRN